MKSLIIAIIPKNLTVMSHVNDVTSKNCAYSESYLKYEDFDTNIDLLEVFVLLGREVLSGHPTTFHQIMIFLPQHYLNYSV